MKKSVYLLFVICLLASYGQVNATFQDSVLKTSDMESQTEYSLVLAKDPEDNGVYAAIINIHNNSHTKKHALSINDYEAATFMITIRDGKGEVISKPLKIFSSEEKQSTKTVEILPQETRQWIVPIAGRLKDGLQRDKLNNCRIQVGIVAESHPVKVISLYDTNVVLTKKALSGDAKAKYKASLNQN